MRTAGRKFKGYLTTAATVVALSMAGCGGDAGEAAREGGAGARSEQPDAAPAARPGSGEQAGSDTAAAPREIVHAGTITIRGGRIEVTPEELDAGQMTILVVNADDRSHAIEIYSEHYGRWRTARLAPGGTAELSMRMPAAEFEVFCPLDNHRETLNAKLRVR